MIKLNDPHELKPGSLLVIVIPSKEGIQELYILDSRLRGNDNCDHSVIPSKEGIQELYILDSRLRGNDKKGDGNDKSGSGNDSSDDLSAVVIPVSFTCHPRENGDPVEVSSPRKRGSREYKN
ncbi:MAG: hypothetical protein SFT93_04995 [Rickettsiaceae bacterium]|nr:hypothetical protein [Rickettsiaceae bacterium]